MNHVLKEAGKWSPKAKKMTIDTTHLTYLETKHIYQKAGQIDRFEAAKKFALVRSPVNRVCSFYEYIASNKAHQLHEKVAEMSFAEFVVWLIDHMGDQFGITTCFDHLTNENDEVPSDMQVFDLTEVDERYDEILALCGFDPDERKQLGKAGFPRLNVSKYVGDVCPDSTGLSLIEYLFEDDYLNFFDNHGEFRWK